jgi:hypothetical protein
MSGRDVAEHTCALLAGLYSGRVREGHARRFRVETSAAQSSHWAVASNAHGVTMISIGAQALSSELLQRDALPSRRPVALALPLDREMAYWLYRRAYELFACHKDFRDLFGDAELDAVFGALFVPFRAAGFMRRTPEGYEVTDSGAFWNIVSRTSTASRTSSGCGGSARGCHGRVKCDCDAKG